MCIKSISERQGFEPWVPFRTRAFQARAFDHSATSPKLLPYFIKTIYSNSKKNAEAGGFEPPMALRPFRFSKPVHSTSYATPPKLSFGGAEIRTLGGLTPTTVFKTAALDHSATPPT